MGGKVVVVAPGSPEPGLCTAVAMEEWASPWLHRRERCLVTRRISVGFARDPMEALESPSGASSIEEKRWRCPMADDDFEFRIGRSTADRSLNRELLIAGHRAGRQVRRSIQGRRFTGERDRKSTRLNSSP